MGAAGGDLVQQVYTGAQAAGVRIAGVSEVGDVTDVFAGTKGQNETVIGQRIDLTVRIGADGRPLPRREDADPTDPPATSLLRIEVTPALLFDGDGEPVIRWHASVRQVDVATNVVFTSAVSGPSKADVQDLQGDRPTHEYLNDPSYLDAMVEGHASTPADAVAAALRQLAGDGRMHQGQDTRRGSAAVQPRMSNGAKVAAVLGTAAVIAVGAVILTGGGDGAPNEAASAEPAPTEVASADPGPSEDDAATPTPSELVAEPSPEPSPVPEEFLDLVSIYDDLYGDDGLPESVRSALLGSLVGDPEGDLLYSRSDTPPGRRSGSADILGFGRYVGTDFEVQKRFSNNWQNVCSYTVSRDSEACAEGSDPSPSTPLAIVSVVLADRLLGGDEAGEAIVAYVADRDGLVTNNWRPQGAFDWDFFQATDTWFELVGDLGVGTWTLNVSEVTDDQRIVSSTRSASAVVRGNAAVFLVPEVSVPADAFYRVSAFVHDGSYAPGVSGGDVSGGDPTEPLRRD